MGAKLPIIGYIIQKMVNVIGYFGVLFVVMGVLFFFWLFRSMIKDGIAETDVPWLFLLPSWMRGKEK